MQTCPQKHVIKMLTQPQHRILHFDQLSGNYKCKERETCDLEWLVSV